jgi:hypothetical protein
MNAKRIILGMSLLGACLAVTGCSTEPSGGKLPPPREVGSAEAERAKALSDANAMYSKGAQSGGFAGMPAAPKTKSAAPSK